jgi:hypothetical protein
MGTSISAGEAMKKRYGNLTNIVEALYEHRKVSVGDDKVATQKALSLAIDIAYHRPVQDTALLDLAAACHKLTPDTLELILVLKQDAMKHYPSLMNRIQTILVWS